MCRKRQIMDIADLIHIPATDLAERVHTTEHLLLWQVRGGSHFELLHPHRRATRTLQLTTGHALWLPAGYRHTVHVHADSTLLPTFYPVASTATRLTGPVIVPVSEVLTSLILAQLQLNTTAIRPPADIARQILALIEDAPKVSDSLPTPTSVPARRIAEAIRFNPGDDRTVAELAASVHTSLRSIQRHFAAETGMNLQQWRTRARLSAGAELLRSGSSLAAVAHRTGYADVSSFCRAFKSHYGVPTGEYLKQYAPGIAVQVRVAG
jgi:AraC-like DNA-binding protein